MCGIFARINPLAKAVDAAACRVATDLLAHRGPDSSGEWMSPAQDVFLGFRRLSILDLSDRANQPMRHPEGAGLLIFNGEIYNFRSLREELRGLGCVFETDGDTEVLMHALAQWGERALLRLEGMFGFTWWNPRTRTALIVRDFLGIKPVSYWRPRGGGIAVSSEIKSFYAMEDFDPQFDPDTLPEYLRFRTLCGGRTLLRGVCDLPPGHLVRYDQNSDSIELRRYWHPNNVVGQIRTRERDAVDRVSESLRRSVHSHLVADVPVGVQFSGGIDSTLVASFARREMQGDLRAFHCGVQDQELSETPYATEFAKSIGVRLRVTKFDSGIFLSDLFDRLMWHRDEPLGHPNAVGVYLISAAAKREVTVLLSGEGADELFAGYWRHSHALRSNLLRKCRWLTRLPRLRSSAYWVEMPPDHEIAARSEFLDRSLVSRLLGRDAHEASVERRVALFQTIEAPDPLAAHQMFDVLTYLPDLLMRQDKMSMAASIENRVPFVTPSMLALGLGLDRASRATWTRQKIVLKRIFESNFPGSDAHRRKIGFAVPLSRWLKTSGGQDRIAAVPTGPLRDYIDLKAFAELQHDRPEVAWVVMSLSEWMRIFLSKRAVCGGLRAMPQMSVGQLC